MDFAGNEGEFHRNLGEKVTIKGEGTKAASEYSGENIRTFADTNGNVVVKMDKNLKTETIVATGKDGKMVKSVLMVTTARRQTFPLPVTANPE